LAVIVESFFNSNHHHHHFIYNPSQKLGRKPKKDRKIKKKQKRDNRNKNILLITTNKGQTEMIKDGKTSGIR